MGRARLQSLPPMVGLVAASLTLAVVILREGGRPQGRHSSQSGIPQAVGAATVPREPVEVRGPADVLSEGIDTPQELRSVLRYCREAEQASASRLKQAALTSGDPLVAGNSIRALGRLGLARTSTGIPALLDDPRPRIRQETLIALGKSGDPAALPHLAPLIKSEDATLRALAIQALGRLGGTRARSLVEAILSDSTATASDRAFARSALSRPRPTLASSSVTPSRTQTPDAGLGQPE